MLAGFGIGNGVQAFEVSSALESAGIPRLVTGIVLGAAVFAVVIGGIKRIAHGRLHIGATDVCSLHRGMPGAADLINACRGAQCIWHHLWKCI